MTSFFKTIEYPLKTVQSVSEPVRHGYAGDIMASVGILVAVWRQSEFQHE